MEARYSRLQMEAAKVAGERTEVLTQVEHLEQQVIQARAGVDQLTREQTLRRENLAATETALAQIQERVDDLEQQMMRATSHLELLKGLLASHEGYSSGVKALLIALDEGRLPKEGVNGVLAELILGLSDDLLRLLDPPGALVQTLFELGFLLLFLRPLDVCLSQQGR